MSKRVITARARLVIAAVAGLAIAACVLLLVLSNAAKSPADQAREKSVAMAKAREKQRGFTDKVTVAVLSDNVARPAQPRPAELPPLIKAPAACKVTLDPVRDLIDEYPTGLAAPASALNTLTTALARIDRSCAPDVALKFRQQELLPWQTWQVPAGYKIPPVTPAPAATTRTLTPEQKMNDKVAKPPTSTKAPKGKKTTESSSTKSTSTSSGGDKTSGSRTKNSTSTTSTAPPVLE